jgi:hypothetical protein
MISLPLKPPDPLLPLVAEVVSEILEAGDVVAPLDVLLRLEIIDSAQVELWRRGGLPYLERGITAGLSRVSRILRLVAEHSRAIGLEPAAGKYLRRGTGPNRRLRFSKRGDAASERAYTQHFIRPRTARPASASET